VPKATPASARTTRLERAEAVPAASRRYGGLSADERRAGRRERLIDAATDCFGSRGFSATTIEEICAAANVTARHFYEEFDTRESLLRAIYDAITSDLLEKISAAIYDTNNISMHDVVHRGATAYFGAITSDARKARIVAVEVVGISPAFEAHRRRSIDAFAAQAARSADRLTAIGITPTIDYGLFSVALIGAGLELTNYWVLAENRPSVGALIDLVTAIWTRSLSPDYAEARTP